MFPNLLLLLDVVNAQVTLKQLKLPITLYVIVRQYSSSNMLYFSEILHMSHFLLPSVSGSSFFPCHQGMQWLWRLQAAYLRASVQGLLLGPLCWCLHCPLWVCQTPWSPVFETTSFDGSKIQLHLLLMWSLCQNLPNSVVTSGFKFKAIACLRTFYQDINNYFHHICIHLALYFFTFLTVATHKFHGNRHLVTNMFLILVLRSFKWFDCGYFSNKNEDKLNWVDS